MVAVNLARLTGTASILPLQLPSGYSGKFYEKWEEEGKLTGFSGSKDVPMWYGWRELTFGVYDYEEK
ncbi:uncharacterized protein FIBRA_06232 [Fibroporia radiculosa]|uniref:Uncharacterized protein n=1 Tax=Fibroporia radiculosa TaxID=599839 RepID=J4GAV4_9APHY|nr:uncharacterized protein FIBRA_06232 [Fibroporia radiculosa]CCM04073.1 predicted protein [Fibroporia radiculosa]